MVEVFAFQIDSRPAALLAEPLGKIQRRRPADIVPVQFVEFLLETRIGDGFFVLGRQFLQGMGQGFGHITAAERSKTAGGIGNFYAGWHGRFSLGVGWNYSFSYDFARMVKIDCK